MLNPGSPIDVETLLQDDDFIRWVISADKASTAYWENWQQQDPVRKTVLQEAKTLVLSVYNRERMLVEELLDKDLVHSAWEEISLQVQTKTAKRFWSPRITGWAKYAAAASIVVVAGMIFFLVQRKPEQAPAVSPVGRVSVSDADPANVQFSNNANALRLINLPDGSRIILAKNSSLHYRRLFNTDKREVYLTGEAFFEVAKEARRPFYVFSGNVVTKVLGTSFRIISDDQRGQVTVAVRSGKVKVFRQNDARHEQGQYLLNRNEQLVFRNKEAKPVKASVQNDVIPVNEIPALLNFSFDEASLADILGALAKSYNVEILYDQTKNEKCRVTVVLDGKSLYDKLDLLCKVINATYHTDGARIYLDGKGCN